MVLEGVVTNVTKFGAFVDIGVHQDGLVHISELSNRFIKDPSEAVKAGQIVKVKVLNADVKSKRIALSMKALMEPVQKNQRPNKPSQQAAPQPSLNEKLAALSTQMAIVLMFGYRYFSACRPEDLVESWTCWSSEVRTEKSDFLSYSAPHLDASHLACLSRYGIPRLSPRRPWAGISI